MVVIYLKHIHSTGSFNGLFFRHRFLVHKIKGLHHLEINGVSNSVAVFVQEVHFDLFQDWLIIHHFARTVVITEVRLSPGLEIIMTDQRILLGTM